MLHGKDASTPECIKDHKLILIAIVHFNLSATWHFGQIRNANVVGGKI